MNESPSELPHFTHQGRKYRLFRRGRRYYLHVQHDRKRHLKSLGTTVKEVAISKGKKFLDALFTGRWQDLAAKREAAPQAVTLAQVVQVYPRVARISPRTIRNNILAMQLIVRRGLGADPEKIRLDQIGAELVRRFQDGMTDDYCRKASSAEPMQRSARELAGRTSRSYVRQARNLFNNRNALPDRYAEHGISLPPSITEFMTCRVAGSNRKREYLAPPDTLVKTAFKEILKLAKTDRNAFLAFWLAAGAGLRRGEIRNARWEHLVERDGLLWVSGGIGKDGERIEVPFQTKAVEAIAPFRRAEGFILTERGLRWARRLNSWMRKQGWQTEKKLHELRAYIGSMIYRVDPVAAMQFMRHKSILVTEQFYVRYGTQHKPVDVL